jgi:hypothetical protein
LLLRHVNRNIGGKGEWQRTIFSTGLIAISFAL